MDTNQETPTMGGSEPREYKIMNIILNEDVNSSNINELFDSYGCNSLEAKVPVIEDPLVEKLMSISGRQQKMATLAFKSNSAATALGGHAPRTRNKVLKIVEINGETVLSAGETRERSPVNKSDLDDELETYMQETARVRASKALGQNWPLEEIKTNSAPLANDNVVKTDKDLETMLDDDLEAYKREGLRLRAQQKALTALTDRQRDREDYDDDAMDFSG